MPSRDYWASLSLPGAAPAASRGAAAPLVCRSPHRAASRSVWMLLTSAHFPVSPLSKHMWVGLWKRTGRGSGTKVRERTGKPENLRALETGLTVRGSEKRKAYTTTANLKGSGGASPPQPGRPGRGSASGSRELLSKAIVISGCQKASEGTPNPAHPPPGGPHNRPRSLYDMPG